ncbi:MAG: GxxExxY protein [Deltaproteobacteria bacterium]
MFRFVHERFLARVQPEPFTTEHTMSTARSEADRTYAAIAASLGGRDQSIKTTAPILYKDLSYSITGAAIEVHRHLGPGQLESTYERALAKELAHRGIPVRSQVPLTASYKGEAVGEFYADAIVDEKVILELKCVDRVLAVHRSQLLSYLRATGLRLGIIINFAAPIVWKSMRRVVL